MCVFVWQAICYWLLAYFLYIVTVAILDGGGDDDDVIKTVVTLHTCDLFTSRAKKMFNFDVIVCGRCLKLQFFKLLLHLSQQQQQLLADIHWSMEIQEVSTKTKKKRRLTEKTIVCMYVCVCVCVCVWMV